MFPLVLSGGKAYSYIKLVSQWGHKMGGEFSLQHAVILCGAGANAAYEVGVLKAILQESWGRDRNPPVDPFCFAATSVGALNAAVMVAQAHRSPREAIDYLEKLWLNRIASEGESTVNGIFRIRTDPTQYLDPQVWLKEPLKPLEELSADFLQIGRRAAQRIGLAVATEGPLLDRAVVGADFSEFVDISPGIALLGEAVDLGKILLSPTRLRITAVNWETGKPKTFANDEVGGSEGISIIAGAFCPPGVAQPQMVEGYPYVDASLLEQTPLKPAIDARGADSKTGLVLHIIYLDTNLTDIPVPPLPNTFATLYRAFLLAFSRSVDADLAKAAATNERIRMRELLALVASGSPEALEEAIRTKVGAQAVPFWHELNKDTADKAPLTVHRYCPLKHIHGFQFIQFERKRIEQLIEAGYHDALRHDCEESCCIRRPA
ncbi:MAG TPA: patatin-like phospholipase family protein [Acidobacteriota bacterium]|nr:patatin-like phospholipase family protein [Acidobacteriota bacterium]